MKALGNFILSGRYQAAGAVTLLTMMSLLVPPLSFLISGAPVGLVTLRKGPGPGLQCMAGALLLTTLVGYVSGLGPGLGLAFTFGTWLPVWLCSNALRSSVSQTPPLLIAGIMGLALVLALGSYGEALGDWWKALMETFLQQNLTAEEGETISSLLDTLAPLLPGLLAAGIVVSLMSTVLMARYWQAHLFNPGGFGPEFRALLLPRGLAPALVICLLAALIGPGAFGTLAKNALAVIVVVFVFQGLASVHRIVERRALGRLWLIVLYVMLLFMPQISLLVACLGLADVLQRQRNLPPPGHDGESPGDGQV